MVTRSPRNGNIVADSIPKMVGSDLERAAFDYASVSDWRIRHWHVLSNMEGPVTDGWVAVPIYWGIEAQVVDFMCRLCG